MSTKTTFKRIALVAVAAMGFGMLSAVPSNAAAGDFETVPTAATLYTTSGTAVSTTVAIDVTDTASALGASTVTATMTSAPAGSTAAATWTSTGIESPFVTSGTAGNTHPVTYAANVATIAADSDGTGVNIANNTPKLLGTLNFTPVVSGKYVITLTQGGVLAAGTEVNGTVTIYVDGTALTVAQSGVGSSTGIGVAGGQIAFSYTTPNGTPTSTKFNVTATGGNLVSGTGVRSDAGATANNPTNINGSTAADGLTFTTTTETTSGVYTFVAATPTAGTFTARISSISATTGVPTVVGTVTVTVSATAESTLSVPLSTAFIGTGSGATCATADATAASLRFSATAAGPVANVCVTLKDINGLALNGQALSATVSGPGLIIAEANQNGVASGNARVAALTSTTMASTNVAQIGISPDGTKGVSTISIFAGTTLVATKTLTFYGTVATLTATQNYAIARSGVSSATLSATPTANLLGTSDTTVLASVGTVAATPAVTVVAKDSDGNVVPGVTVSGVIANPAVISSVEIAEAAGTALTIGAAGGGTHLVAVRSAIGGVSGTSTTVTFRTPNPLVPGAFITTDAIKFTLGGSKLGGTVTMTLDKATYAPGERMIVKYTAKDAAGNKVYDGVTVADPSANKNVAGLTGGVFIDGEEIIGDEAGEYVYAPTTSGAFVLTVGTGTATGAEITATATVSDDASTTASQAAADAAAEATDAANAATDAANAAAEAADAATAAAQDAADAVAALSVSVSAMVSDLKKQITALTNLVIKIQKKVKA